jgi:hypothetical protein
MSRTHIFLRCMHPRHGRRSGIGQMKMVKSRNGGIASGKSKWEKPLADWIMATGVGLLGNELHENEAERVERNDGWRREPFT